MPISYTNRRGDEYFVREVITKKGASRYYIVKDISKVPADELINKVPEGFEFYEHPLDAKVVLRKKTTTSITKHELEIVENEMKRHETVEDFIVEPVANAIYIHIGHLSRRDFPMEEEWLMKVLQFDPKLKFVKKENGEYLAQRYCRIPSVDSWITIETSKDLHYLAEKYCYHIDKESLLDFWIEGEDDW